MAADEGAEAKESKREDGLRQPHRPGLSLSAETASGYGEGHPQALPCPQTDASWLALGFPTLFTLALIRTHPSPKLCSRTATRAANAAHTWKPAGTHNQYSEADMIVSSGAATDEA